MKTIYLSNHDIVETTNFALHTVDEHYHRMWKNRNTGISKIAIGKLGEIAVAKYLRAIGITTVVNTRIDIGSDTGDLLIWEEVIEVKSKNFRKLLPPLNQIFLHIPVDQYEKMIGRGVLALSAVALRNYNDKSIKQISSLETLIAGGIMLEEYDKKKVLHCAGEEVASNFIMPPPDSYAVPWSELYSLEKLLDYIKAVVKKNIYNSIQNREPCFYDEIVNNSKYSKGTVHQMVEELLCEGLLIRTYDEQA